MSALPVPFLKLRTFPINGRDAGPGPIKSREFLYIDHLLPFPVRTDFWNCLLFQWKFINIELHMYTSVSKSFPKRMMPP
jgi:hypothetical protein